MMLRLARSTSCGVGPCCWRSNRNLRHDRPDLVEAVPWRVTVIWNHRPGQGVVGGAHRRRELLVEHQRLYKRTSSRPSTSESTSPAAPRRCIDAHPSRPDQSGNLASLSSRVSFTSLPTSGCGTSVSLTQGPRNGAEVLLDQLLRHLGSKSPRSRAKHSADRTRW